MSIASLRLSVVFAELAGIGVDSACGQDRHALAAGGEKVGFDVSDLMEEFRRQIIGTGDGPQVRLGQTVPSCSSTFTSRRQGNGFSGAVNIHGKECRTNDPHTFSRLQQQMRSGQQEGFGVSCQLHFQQGGIQDAGYIFEAVLNLNGKEYRTSSRAECSRLQGRLA